ncbi:hypothetical protein ACFWOJ_35610 [Streptomyces sp. NPDC058439]|uniref:hypothetical protein n=1 Tax=Streptomyces sp. NPDC058439 TaxID=3346500 RepID=UPI0036576803
MRFSASAGLDEAASAEEIARRLGGKVSPAVVGLLKALVVQAGGLGAVAETVEGFGGFAKQYEQIEKVSAHHGNLWKPLLYGQIDLAKKLEFTATSEDGRVLDALAHAQRHQSARGEYITGFGGKGREADISFATQNWPKVVVDKTSTGQFVRKQSEAIFTYLAKELRCGDVAVVGSEEYADWSEPVLEWEAVQEKLADYLVEVRLCEAGENAEFDEQFFRQQLEDKLRAGARRGGGGRRAPGQRGPGHRPGDGHPVAEAAPLGGAHAPGEEAGAGDQIPDAGAHADRDSVQDRVLGGVVAPLRTGLRLTGSYTSADRWSCGRCTAAR